MCYKYRCLDVQVDHLFGVLLRNFGIISEFSEARRIYKILDLGGVFGKRRAHPFNSFLLCKVGGDNLGISAKLVL